VADPIDVTGGTDGIAAHCERLRAVAGRLGDAARELGAAVFALHGYLFDPGVAAAGVASAKELFCFEADLGDALDGPRGLTWVAAEFGVLDVQLRAAAAAYERIDLTVASMRDCVVALDRLPRAVVTAGVVAARDDPVAALQALVTSDPGLADLVVRGLGLPRAIARVAAALPDGRPVVTLTGRDRGGGAGRPPRCLADIMSELDRRNAGPHGAIDVRILTDRSGRRHVLVDITGTKTAALLPTADVTGLLTDGKALVGQRSTYENGVLRALRRAGVGPHDDVMLVGHSEGGLVAVTAARDAVRTGRFRITHVVTAGAPIGLTAGALPRRVQVLALEGGGDVVPHLDGAANPDRANVTTVTGRTGNGTIGDEHGLTRVYVPLAEDVDAAADRSVRDFLRGASGWFRATEVRTITFVVTRGTR
jgi:hypothetical protein